MYPLKSHDSFLKTYHGVPQTLNISKGYRVAVIPPKKVGQLALDDESVAVVRSHAKSSFFDPVMTYGRVKAPITPPFRPDFVRNDKIVLSFSGFFRQKVHETNQRQYDRIRYVKVMYFMEDDTMTVIEPPIFNSGYPQGRIVRRARILKDPQRQLYYSWKDLNIGIDLNLFGIIYHLTDCDKFTRDFLTSNGIELNEVKIQEEPMEKHTVKDRPATAPVNFSTKRKVKSQANSIDGIALCFNCIRIESRKKLYDCLTYKLFYFLADDTVAVKELKENADGRDYFPLLLKRMQIPKNSKQMINNFIAFDPLPGEVEKGNNDEYISPADLIVGQEIIILGHRFLLYDCDAQTRMYYQDVLKTPQPDKVNIETVIPRKAKYIIPEYLGFGSPEDSMASVLNLVPKVPRKDIVKYLLNSNKYLCFGCVLDNAHPEDKNRQFVLRFSLADGTISITEKPVANSGIQGGKFLSSQLVIKPGCDPDLPDYYTCKDLNIGATLLINSHRFKIISADKSVYNYMKENPELFSADGIEKVQEYLTANGAMNKDQANPCEGRNDKINENIEPKMESSENVGAVGEQMQFNDIPCKCPGLMDYNNKRFFI